ncbi:hypothetical protein ACV354_30880, partial [Pseudomonas aeruginosa]
MAMLSATVFELLARVGLPDHARQSPDPRPGAQKPRGGIAPALACRPAIPLCHEATSALDPHPAASALQLSPIPISDPTQ